MTATAMGKNQRSCYSSRTAGVCVALLACSGCSPDAEHGGGGHAGSAADAGKGGAAGGGASGQAGTAQDGGAGAGSIGRGSFTLSATSLSFISNCVFTPQTLTITNTSSVALNWTASGDFSAAFLSPVSSTLAPGEAIDVSVVPRYSANNLISSTVSIDADVADSQSLEITEQISGQFISSVLSDVDFGNVSVGTSAQLFVTAVAGIAGAEILTSSNPDFQLSGLVPVPQLSGAFGWTLTFTPSITGATQSVLLYGTEFGEQVCAPNSIMARGVGVGRAPTSTRFL